MIKKITSFVSIGALSFVLHAHANAQDHASEVSTLKSQIDRIEKQLKELKIQQKKSFKEQQDSGVLKTQIEARQENLEKKIQEMDFENQELKLASKSSVRSGSMPGSFLIPGTDTSLKIQGYVKVDGVYSSKLYGGDKSASMNSNFGAIPLNKSKVASRGGEFTPLMKESRFGFDTQTVHSAGVVDTRFEFDGYGGAGAYSVNLRKAYIDFKCGGGAHGFLVGKQSTTFSDPDGTNGIETLDFGGILGTPGDRPVQVRYTAKVSPKVQLQFSAEEPETTYREAIDLAKYSSGTDEYKKAFAEYNNVVTDDGSLKTLDHASGSTMERFPDMVAHLRLGDDKAHASFRGLITEHTLSDDGFKKRVWGYGLAHTGHYTFSNKDSICYDVVFGNGLSKWMTAGTTASYIYDTDPSKRKFYLQNNLGLSLAYKHHWTDTLRSNLGVGFLRSYNRGEMKNYQTNKILKDLHVNLIESPMKNLDVGIEYACGQRRVEALTMKGSEAVSGTGTKKKGTVHLVQVSAKYSF